MIQERTVGLFCTGTYENLDEPTRRRQDWMNEQCMKAGLDSFTNVKITLPNRPLTAEQTRGLFLAFEYPYEVEFSKLYDYGYEFIGHAGRVEWGETLRKLAVTEEEAMLEMSGWIRTVCELQKTVRGWAQELDIDSALCLWTRCTGYEKRSRFDELPDFADAVNLLIYGCTIAPPGLDGARFILEFANRDMVNVLLGSLALSKEDLATLLKDAAPSHRKEIFSHLKGIVARGEAKAKARDESLPLNRADQAGI